MPQLVLEKGYFCIGIIYGLGGMGHYSETVSPKRAVACKLKLDRGKDSVRRRGKGGRRRVMISSH